MPDRSVRRNEPGEDRLARGVKNVLRSAILNFARVIFVKAAQCSNTWKSLDRRSPARNDQFNIDHNALDQVSL